MIDRERIEKCLKVIDELSEESIELMVSGNGAINLRIYPKGWIYDHKWSDEKRHQVLALVTTLVGKMEKQVDGINIGYKGDKDNLSIRLNYVDQCKVVGYKTVTKTIRKEIEREPEYETEEVEQRIPITDYDIRTGKFKEDDIEVTA